MLKRALLVGVDAYDYQPPLGGCVNDVRAVGGLLERNEDDSPNFACQTLTSQDGRVTRGRLLEHLQALLGAGADVALFYFAGHGAARPGDVVLTTQEGQEPDPGVALSQLLGMVQTSPVREVIVMLDCCFSGGAGGVPQLGGDAAVLRAGVSLLTASRRDQAAMEEEGRGAFSLYLCGALGGGAADVLGKVTLASLYAYLSESFGAWDQRPTFKANVDRLGELRRCAPSVPVADLRQLAELFPSPDHVFPLDPSYEPLNAASVRAHTEVFALLQRCRSAKLVEPVGTEHMYFAAMQRLGCRLTPLGQHYRRLDQRGLL